MSESDPTPASAEAPAPPLKIRKRWWWAIYLGSCFGPAIIMSFLGTVLQGGQGADISQFFMFPIAGLTGGLLLCLLLPLGLAAELLCVLLLPPSLIFDSTNGTFWNFAGPLLGSLGVLSAVCSYWIFAQHWRLTLEATSQRTFRLLMLSLILLVCASWIAFSNLFSGPFHLQH